MKAEIIAVGTEILLGEIVDTDSQYIAARLPALGIDLFWVTQVGDNLERARRRWSAPGSAATSSSPPAASARRKTT